VALVEITTALVMARSQPVKPVAAAL
jgi:hypothetical protein